MFPWGGCDAPDQGCRNPRHRILPTRIPVPRWRVAKRPCVARGVAGSVGNLNTTPVTLVRTGATRVAAFSMFCPHAGTRIYVVNNASFRCPNQGALSYSAGVNLPSSPPRTTNLLRLTVS